MGKGKKSILVTHAKSSAALVSLGIHAVLIVIALSFVAVTVIQKEEQVFEAKPVKRPNVKLKKLQVPVNIKEKKVQRPKLRKRIVVKPRMNQAVPDIKMPEITGVKGGLGNAGSNDFGGGVGFSMPEIELFGIKGKSEKVFIILDASPYIMIDEIGGIPAYTTIKSELVHILEGLNSTVLFNIAIWDGGELMLFPQLVPASQANVAKVHDWLKPLNAVSKGMGDTDYGIRTAAPGAVSIPGPFQADPLAGPVGHWARPVFAAMRQQADTVFVLTSGWGFQAYLKKNAAKWSESEEKRWSKNVEKARAKHKKENDRRRAAGDPPRIVPDGDLGLVGTYLPGVPLPPMPEWGGHTPKEMVEAFSTARSESKKAEARLTGGLPKKDRDKFNINVIQFVRADGQGVDERLSRVASLTKGRYQTIKGLDAIKSSASGEYRVDIDSAHSGSANEDVGLPEVKSSAILPESELVANVSATATTYFGGEQHPSFLVNNLGISNPYDETATHSENDNAYGQWISSGGPVDNEELTFDLGGTYDLGVVYIWQANQHGLYGRGVKQFDLLTSSDGVNFAEVASDLNLAISTGGDINAQAFVISQKGVTHVRIGIDSAHSGSANEYVGLSEVKFGAL